jgi:NADH-quinone oxidoreductase subunit A
LAALVENSAAIDYNRRGAKYIMAELAIAFLVFGLLSGVMILVNFVLGPRKPNPAREKPFECGSPPLQAGIGPVDIPFFLVALLFLLLDVEIVFVYPLALAFRGRGFGGLAALGAFFFVLALGFAYAWKKGIFRWS